jgi:hypothetical protein
MPGCELSWVMLSLRRSGKTYASSHVHVVVSKVSRRDRLRRASLVE